MIYGAKIQGREWQWGRRFKRVSKRKTSGHEYLIDEAAVAEKQAEEAAAENRGKKAAAKSLKDMNAAEDHVDEKSAKDRVDDIVDNLKTEQVDDEQAFDYTYEIVGDDDDDEFDEDAVDAAMSEHEQESLETAL